MKDYQAIVRQRLIRMHFKTTERFTKESIFNHDAVLYRLIFNQHVYSLDDALCATNEVFKMDYESQQEFVARAGIPYVFKKPYESMAVNKQGIVSVMSSKHSSIDSVTEDEIPTARSQKNQKSYSPVRELPILRVQSVQNTPKQHIFHPGRELSKIVHSYPINSTDELYDYLDTHNRPLLGALLREYRTLREALDHVS